MEGEKTYRTAIGQDSHRFDKRPMSPPECESPAAVPGTYVSVPATADKDAGGNRKLILGGIVFEGHVPLKGNSDADVVLHSIINAISGITCVNVLGAISDEMCLKQGITDSARYLERALADLEAGGWEIGHLSISIECSTPLLSPRIPEMRARLSELLGIPGSSIGITATTGEGLTAFGKGEGIQAFSCITVCRQDILL